MHITRLIFAIYILCSIGMYPVYSENNSAGICTKDGTSLSEARNTFAAECSQYERKDCDPIGGVWVCSSENISQNINTTESSNIQEASNSGGEKTRSCKIVTHAATTQENTSTNTDQSLFFTNANGQIYAPSADACYTLADGLSQAQSRYASTCNKKRIDCDPLQGTQWICSSEQIGMQAPDNIAGTNGTNVHGEVSQTIHTNTVSESNATGSSSSIVCEDLPVDSNSGDTQVSESSNPTQDVVSENTNSNSHGECSVQALGFGSTQTAFQNTCPGYSIKDCDPYGSNGEWICSSEDIGPTPSSSQTNTQSNNTPTENATVTPSSTPTHTGGGSIGTNGLIVMEAESTSSSLGSWKKGTFLGGYSGDGHITFEGNVESHGPATSPLRYSFTADKTGEYRLMMRIQRKEFPGHSDYSNDGYVRLEGDFTAGTNSPTTALMKTDQKYYGGNTSWSWNPGAPFDINHRKYQANYNLKAGQQYTLVLSGRSKFWNVDRMIFAHSSVDNSVAQSATQSSISSNTNTQSIDASFSSSIGGGANEQNVGMYKKGDLVSLHYDYCPDPDDGHATVAGKSVIDYYGLNHHVVMGTCGYDILSRFDSKGYPTMNATYGSNYLDAMKDRNGSIETTANTWLSFLRNGSTVHVAEGGQSDFTSDVLRSIKAKDGNINLKKVNVIQHSADGRSYPPNKFDMSEADKKVFKISYNELFTRESNLNYIKSVANYITVPNGNVSGNGSPGLGYKYSPSFVEKAKASYLGSQWNIAFAYLNPSCSNQVYTCKLDFSDTVELLKVTGDMGLTDVNDFATKFLSRTSAYSGSASSTATSSATTSSVTSSSSSNTTSSASVCTVEGNGLSESQANFSSRCVGYTRKDCDPVGGKWICSSENIDAGSSATTSSSSTSATTSTTTESPSTENIASTPTTSENATVDCSAGNMNELESCLAQGSNKKIGLTANIVCSGGDCCKNGGAIFNLKNKSNITIEGNGKVFLRTDMQRSCSLVDIENSQNITFKNITFDDDIRDLGCKVADSCPRMLHIKRSSNIAFYNSNIKNGKGYVMYVQQVNGFTFDSSRFTNAGVLGMYIGHGDTPSSNIKITNSYFGNNSTNGLALLGVTGNNISSNIISGNTFERNHYIGQWAVSPQYGTGLTGGGQVYFARANNVTFKNNIIKNGSCELCKPTGSAIHGLELSEPNKPSLSNILIENNTFTNNSSYGIYKNSGATLSNVTIRSNSIDSKGTNISGAD